MTIRTGGTVTDIETTELSQEAPLEVVIDRVNLFFRQFDFLVKSLGIEKNFACEIKRDIRFEASGDALGRDVVRVEHSLGVIPRFRIILRQEGDGVLDDVTSRWNNKFIVLRNNGASPVTATFVLLKE